MTSEILPGPSLVSPGEPSPSPVLELWEGWAVLPSGTAAPLSFCYIKNTYKEVGDLGWPGGTWAAATSS